MGQAGDMIMLIILMGGAYYLITSGKLNEILQGAGLPPVPFGPGGGGGGVPPSGGGGPGGTATTGAACGGKTIYQSTGQSVDNSKKTKDGTRHYASGKPDDVTQEWSTSVNYKNYEFTCYVTVTQVDHDDTVSMKFGGTHIGSGWYDCGISFNAGECCLGKEEKHPSTDQCVVKGQSIGKIVGKKIGMKCIIFGAGGGSAQIEMWADPSGNGQWKQVCPRSNGVGGFHPSSSKQECTIRIDAAPGITMHCSSVDEITGPNKGGGQSQQATPALPPSDQNQSNYSRISYT